MSSQRQSRGAQKDAPAKRAQLRSELLIKLEMESNPEALCLVRAAIQRATEALQFQEVDSRAIVLSVDEAITNVIRHAYKGQPGRPIEVTCRRVQKSRNGAQQRGIEVLLQDSGVAVDPATLKGRALEEIRPGGLGLHFIRQSMDEVEFTRRQGKNQLRLVKYLPAAPGPKGE